MKNPYVEQPVHEYYIDHRIRTDKRDAWDEGNAARLPTVAEISNIIASRLKQTDLQMIYSLSTELAGAIIIHLEKHHED